VFADTNDPDYQQILAALEAGKDLLGTRVRYGQPGFRPNRQYVREMKKYGILPESLDADSSPIDIFATDQAYWRTYWLGHDD
jgi:hypothetical protein